LSHLFIVFIGYEKLKKFHKIGVYPSKICQQYFPASFLPLLLKIGCFTATNFSGKEIFFEPFCSYLAVLNVTFGAYDVSIFTSVKYSSMKGIKLNSPKKKTAPDRLSGKES
jgi:hypothetical protein